MARACGAGDRGPRTFTQVPYAKYLKNLNDQDDLANRSRVGTGMTRPNAVGIQARRQTQSDTNLEAGVGLPMPPRTGDELPARELTIRETVEAAYSVRNLLSRGAVIDLMG